MNGDFFFPIPPYTVLSPPISPHTSGIQECDAMASRSSLEYDYLFKIVLVGDAAVGKTNLLACYTSQVCSSFVPESNRLMDGFWTSEDLWVL